MANITEDIKRFRNIVTEAPKMMPSRTSFNRPGTKKSDTKILQAMANLLKSAGWQRNKEEETNENLEDPNDRLYTYGDAMQNSEGYGSHVNCIVVRSDGSWDHVDEDGETYYGEGEGLNSLKAHLSKLDGDVPEGYISADEDDFSAGVYGDDDFGDEE